MDFTFFQIGNSRSAGKRSAIFNCIFQVIHYGFTLLELIMVMVVLGALSSIVIPTYARYIEKARITVAIADIRTLEKDIAAFRVSRNRLPNDMTEMERANLRDPWGEAYEYLDYATMQKKGKDKDRTRRDRFLKPLNQDYDLYSKGKDQDSKPPLTAKVSLDDIVRANDGGFVGLASDFSP